LQNYFTSTESATGASSRAALLTKVESVVTSGAAASSVAGEEQAAKIKIELRMIQRNFTPLLRIAKRNSTSLVKRSSLVNSNV